MTGYREQGPPPCMIHIDKEGVWYHEGAEMIHREFIRLFYQRMTLDDAGRYVIELNDQRCCVDVEDTAYVVRRAVPEGGDGGAPSRIVLSLSDDSTETLASAGLWVGKDNVLYCSVKEGRFPARFNRAAYYQLSEYIEEGEEGFYLKLDGGRYPVKI
ncbi:MAG: DUF1285 domain-containing protein [Deltaproteobacteria bacterium]|nr:DUF1285 domain-containing protein [Deltaproteobacteria bacterium]